MCRFYDFRANRNERKKEGHVSQEKKVEWNTWWRPPNNLFSPIEHQTSMSVNKVGRGAKRGESGSHHMAPSLIYLRVSICSTFCHGAYPATNPIFDFFCVFSRISCGRPPQLLLYKIDQRQITWSHTSSPTKSILQNTISELENKNDWLYFKLQQLRLFRGWCLWLGWWMTCLFCLD